MQLSTYCKIYPSGKDPDSRILFLTRNAAKLQVPALMIREIENRQLSAEEQTTLREFGFLVDDRKKEQAEMLWFMERLNAINTAFHAKVVMNLDCNLACIYCFEGKRKGKFYMTKETADLFLKFMGERLLESPSLAKGGEGGFCEEIKITFYGGEPLLSIELIIYISERLKSLAEDKKIKYSASLITNGTLLTRNVVERLKPLGLKIASVTLDGPGDVHDRYRPFTSGKGSFDTIFRNVKDICDLISVQIGGNYTKENYREFPRLLDYLLAGGLTPERISDLQFDPVTKESDEFALPDFNEGCLTLDEPWIIDAYLYLREESLKRGYRSRKVTPITCMMERKDSFIINYNGDLYKCAGLIGREQFRVGDLSNGIIDYRLSHNLDNWKNDECLNCSYLPLCFGGCRYMKLVRDGSMEGVDCKKPYLDAALRDLVLQDIEPTRP